LAGSEKRILCGFFILLSIQAGLLHAAGYTGSSTCADCHTETYEKWQKSHHYQSMLPASSETVTGNFDNQSFSYGGMTHRFFKRDDGFFVETDNAAGDPETFRISYTFGFYPLQQYLIEFPDGRYQALNIVWDSRPGDEGGQRWFHLYPEEDGSPPIQHDDMLHWTGSFQNWNSRCAACHSTDLKKNYDPGKNAYATTWSEINVSCEACHGPASDHLEWTQGEMDDLSDKGFSVNLNNTAAWTPEPGHHTLSRKDGIRPDYQTEVCAGCHSRRSEMDEDHSDKPFSDLYQLQLLEENLYHPDGQILDEVYVYGSFLQSKMHAAGVACTNCHDPHSNGLVVTGNAVCTQCHQSGTFDAPAHHHHESDSPGAACVNCHMPAKIYMGVDDRRDHSFRVPEPQLTIDLGIPNACNQCHADRDASWAARALEQWGVGGDIRAGHARVLDQTRHNSAGIAPDLFKLAADPSASGILRATAMLETRRFPGREAFQLAQQQLNSPNAHVRAATVRSLEWLPQAERYAMLQPLITDPAKSVRLEVANRLADFDLQQLPDQNRKELERLRNEYLDSLRLNADMPESMLNLGIFLSSSGRPMDAEKAYRQALKLSPKFVPAMLNLADLYRANDMDRIAGPLLEQAIAAAPDQPAAYHALGLLQVRRKNMGPALANLEKAWRLDPQFQRYGYVYGVALYSDNRFDEAIEVLESALAENQGDRELVNALASYYRERGETGKLQKLAEQYPQIFSGSSDL
jgi:predicted CXXCH cytochrome family protein